MTSSRLERFRGIYRTWGVCVLLLYIVFKIFSLPRLTLSLRTPLARYPVLCRFGTSDLLVLEQIFEEREFSCFDELKDVRLIIDCGANVGYASVYLLSRFPSAFVIAIEPDADNFEMLQKNLAPYHGRYSLFQGGIWSKNIGLCISQPSPIDGLMASWAVTVRECKEGENRDVQGMTIDELLMQSKRDHISILKIDIEGAERGLFSAGYESWLPRVQNLSIELHGNDARSIFLNAIAGQNFKTFEAGELTICQRQ